MTAIADSRPAANPLGDLADTVLALFPATYRRWPVGIGLAVFLLYVAMVMAVAWLQPQTDWDVLAYVAIAAERTLDGAAAIHAHAYGVLRENLKPAEFLILTDDAGGYRSHLFADPEAFVSMLGMYRVKWLYCALVDLLGRAVGPVEAMRLISAVSALAFCGIALAWLRAERALVLAPLLAVFLALCGFADLARGTMPDMLFSALLLGGLFAMRRERHTACAVLFVVAYLVRPDNVIFLGVLATLLVVYRQWSWGALAAFAVAAALFVPLTQATGQPGWWTHLYFTAVGHSNTLVGYDPPFSVVAYLTGFGKQLLLAVTAQSWVAILVAELAAWYAEEQAGLGLTRRDQVLMLGFVFGIAAKFVAVPIFDTRIYFPYVVAIALLLAGRLALGRGAAARLAR